MNISESCAECLYEKQAARTQDKAYLAQVRDLLENRKDSDTAPYMVYRFNKIFESCFGKKDSYSEVKKQYNDLVLSIEDDIRKKIVQSEDPLAAALVFSRIGNYIDFGAMNNVDQDKFLEMFSDTQMSENDKKIYVSFKEECSRGKEFLLIADNCGEIVLDKLFLEQLKRRFPKLNLTVMVRGGEVLNDACKEDAYYSGIDKEALIISNGKAIAGTIYELLGEAAKAAVDNADVILAKGQGNYESMSKQGMHVFYAFLCKCDLFTNRFNVPGLTGMFIEEKEE